MPKKNDFKLDVVSVRLVKDAPIYSEHTFNNPADIAAVMGDCMCQFDREVVCVVNLRSDLKPINVHFASVGSLNEAMAHPRELFKSSILSNAATTMLANSEFVALLKQANTDSSKMAEVIGVSEAQLRFVTNTASGMGLIKCGSVVIPFDNQISKDTDLYRLYNTNIHEKIAEQKKKEAMLQ